MNIKLSFDGCGLNDANDAHKRRLFTASRADWDNLKDVGPYIERAVNTYEEMKSAISLCQALLDLSDVRYFISSRLGEQAKLHEALNALRRLKL